MKLNRIAPLAVLALMLAACGKPEEKKEPETPAKETSAKIELTKDAQSIAGIETAAVSLQPMQASLDIPGVVASTTKGHAMVTPPVAGRITTLDVQVGDVVRPGQRIAVLNSSELTQSWALVADARRARDASAAELKQASAEAELAQAKLSAAQQTLSRQKDLAKAGAFSQAPLQQAQSELNDAQSDLLSTQKELNTHSEQLQHTENLFKEGLVSKSEYESAKLEVQQDQLKLDRIKTRVENAKTTYEREKGIASKGLLNAKELQVAEADVRQAKIETDKASLKIRSSKADLANAEKAIRNAENTYHSLSGNGGASGGAVEIVSPIGGTITKLDVSRGQAVERTQVIVEVENLDAVWVTAHVPEAEASKAAKGANVKITAAALPGKEFAGVVQIIGGRIDAKTRSLPVQCLVTDGKGALRPDMFATVHLGVGSKTRVIAVPTGALVTEDRKSFVFVKIGEAFERREVEIGKKDESLVEIRSGLKEGEIIAVKGEFVLKSESKKDELKGEE